MSLSDKLEDLRFP